jgi:hypothetical protein
MEGSDRTYASTAMTMEDIAKTRLLRVARSDESLTEDSGELGIQGHVQQAA